MDAEWLGQANAAVDVALASEGYNEFNSGGIGVDYQPGSVREPFVPPDELSMPGCSERLMGDRPSRGIVGKVHILPNSRYHARTYSHSLIVYRMFGCTYKVLLEMEPACSDPFKKMIGHPAITSRFNWILGEGW